MIKLMRKRLYTIVEQGHDNDWVSYIYDAIILLAITTSIIPLMFIETYPIFNIIEQVTVGLLIMDYLLRWFTADYIVGKGQKGKWWSFLIYPLTPWAIIDFLAILPGLNILGQGFKVLRISRLLRILRLFKFIRYSQNIKILGNVIKREKKILFTVLGIAVFYIFISALVMFNAEPHIDPETGAKTFENFFDALYWATVTLTTVGYGDVTPVTDIGRFISMVSSLFGVAIIALPSGVITAAYIEELRAQKKE
jgi:voltage-gated potassium channel